MRTRDFRDTTLMRQRFLNACRQIPRRLDGFQQGCADLEKVRRLWLKSAPDLDEIRMSRFARKAGQSRRPGFEGERARFRWRPAINNPASQLRARDFPIWQRVPIAVFWHQEHSARQQ